MAYTEADLKANSDKASFSFRPNTIGHTSDKHLPLRTLTQLHFITILPIIIVS